MLNRFGARLWKRVKDRAHMSDAAILSEAPPAIAREMAGKAIACLPASSPPKQHARYLVGRDAMLHVYGTAAHPALPYSVPDRLKLQSQCNDAAIPRLLQVEFTPQRVWLLEDRLHGLQFRAPMGGRTLHEAIELLTTLARLEGPPLRTTPFWDSHRADSIAAAPAALRTRVEEAWEAVGDMKAAPLHGDVRPKNLINGPYGIGLVDWEGFWRHGLPGLDIAYLLTMNGQQGLDPVVNDTLSDRPHRWRGLLTEAMIRCGHTSRTLKPAMLVMAALWSLGEVRRQQLRPGSGRSSRFRHLLATRLGLYGLGFLNLAGVFA